MDPLTLFGLFAVTAMGLFYALERRNSWFILAFAGACVLASVYGFLQGAWPFGLVGAVWVVVAVDRWRRAKKIAGQSKVATSMPTEGRKEEEIILHFIRGTGKAKREDLMAVTKLSRSSLGRLMDQLEAKGLVEQVGERKGAYYRLKEGT